MSTSLYRTVPRLKKRGTAFFPYAVDLEYLDPDTPGDALRQEWGVPRENVLVGMVARFEPWKGHREFLRAAALVRNASPSTRFVLVGDVGFGQAPEYRTQLEELASQLDLSHCLVFAGFRTDLPQCLAAIDVLVHGPVSDQPGGLISLDAMAMQRPVVATDTSRVDKLGWLLPHETGIVVPARDETQMADAILTLVASEKLRHEMGTRGRVYVEQQFSPEHLARHVEAEYLAIAGASGF